MKKYTGRKPLRQGEMLAEMVVALQPVHSELTRLARTQQEVVRQLRRLAIHQAYHAKLDQHEPANSHSPTIFDQLRLR